MKALFTAAGSIGTRHIKNLQAVCSEKNIPLSVDVVRNSSRILPDDLKKIIRNEIFGQNGFDDFYDMIFITDETSTHYDNIMKYKHKGGSMFIEKPIFDTCEYSIGDIVPTTVKDSYYVACPIRFSKYYDIIKKAVMENKVYSARIIFSSYMPNWQKGRDYRKSFRCFNERGGGVDIDSLHEIDYMVSLFGMPQTVHRVSGHYSNLEMEACDLATYLFSYSDKVIEMHLDYFGQTNNRRIELFTENDVIVIYFNKHSYEKQKAGTCEFWDEDNLFYLNEMRYFVDLCLSEGRMTNINPPFQAFQALKLAKGFV